MNDLLKNILGNDGTNGILQLLPGGSTVSNPYMPFIVGIYIIGLFPVVLLVVSVAYILIGASKITRSDGDPKKHEAGIVTVKRAVFAIAILFIIILLTNIFSLVILGSSIYSAPNAFQVCSGTINGVSGNHLVLEYVRAGVTVPTTCVQGGKTSCQACYSDCSTIITGRAQCYQSCDLGACSSGSTVQPTVTNTVTAQCKICATGCAVANPTNPYVCFTSCSSSCPTKSELCKQGNAVVCNQFDSQYFEICTGMYDNLCGSGK